MKKVRLFSIISGIIMMSYQPLFAQDKNIVVRIAKLRIDAAQLDKYMTFLKEEIEAAVRLEPGVLSLYAVAEKNNPSAITIFEIYANDAAYRTHIETPHFKKYKIGTKDMVQSLELIENVPIMLETKRN